MSDQDRSRTVTSRGTSGVPTFFVIGAMKAATTSMCDWLDAQPGLAISRPKEPGIFVSDEAVKSLLPGVEALFQHATANDLRGEGSTDYAKHPRVLGVPERIFDHVAAPKLVYMMRHPVERAMSQFRFEWLLGGHSRDFEEALEKNPELIDIGRYALQLEQWLKVCSPESVLLVFSESFSRDPARQVRRVMQFLGLDPAELQLPPRERSNDSTHLVRRSRLRWLLRDSTLGRVVRPYVPGVIPRLYRRSLTRRSQPVVTSKVKAELARIFDEDLRQLRILTSGPVLTCDTWHDVTAWWDPTLVTGAAGSPPPPTSVKGIKEWN